MQAQIFQVDCVYRKGGNDVFLRFTETGHLGAIRCPTMSKEHWPRHGGDVFGCNRGGSFSECIYLRTGWTVFEEESK